MIYLHLTSLLVITSNTKYQVKQFIKYIKQLKIIWYMVVPLDYLNIYVSFFNYLYLSIHAFCSRYSLFIIIFF